MLFFYICVFFFLFLLSLDILFFVVYMSIYMCAAVPNHRSWSPRSDVAGFMDVMQTKGSRQISRVPSEDAVAPTSGGKIKTTTTTTRPRLFFR